METRTFDFKLQNHKIFKDLKDTFTETSNNLRNLIELKDDVLYLWNSNNNYLVALNVKYLEEHDDSTTYQKLHLLTPPSFAVERLLCGACGTRICAWGPRGAVIAELPSRWGRSGLFDSGKETVLCKSFSLDERFLHTQGDVRRVHWHPTSLSHVLVLVSDNTIRLYNIALKQGPKLVKILTIGPKPTSLIAGKQILDSLGDTAVDFTPIPNTDSLLILRGDGNVFMISCELNAKSPLPNKLTGPLTMYPPADDNYGEESCSISIVEGVSRPSVVVIATCAAVLYHCLLLPEPTNSLNVSITDITTDNAEYALYVVEAVELSIVLGTEERVPQHSYPVHLYSCPGNNATYMCMHAAGVHTVTLPMVGQLQEYMGNDDADIDTVISSLTTLGSVARYLLCTRGPTDQQFCPAVGLVAAPPPLASALILCADGRLLQRYLEPYGLEEQLYKELQLKNPLLENEDINNILKERKRLSFTSIIQEILTRDVSQPLLNFSRKDEPDAKESLEFLTQATLKLRQEYMSRQKRAFDAINKKISGLHMLKQQQAEWHRDLQNDIAKIKQTSEVLKDKWQLAEKHQDDLKYRCSALIRALRSSTATSPAERQLLQELEKYRSMKDLLLDQLERLKDRAEVKDLEMKKWQEEYKKKDIALGVSHSDTISSILQRQTSQISSLIEETKLLKDQLNIV